MPDREIDREIALAIDLAITADAARMIEKAPMPDCLKWSSLKVYLGVSVAVLAQEHGLSHEQVRDLLRAAIELRPDTEQPQKHNPIGEVRELGPMTAEQVNARMDAWEQMNKIERPEVHEEKE